MIVKDEAHVVERCLASVRPHVDAWLVVDTGSTDGTQGVVRRTLDGLPGELVERPWVDFGHNRTEALGLARRFGGYSLVIDADEVFEVPADFAWPQLTADAYYVEHRLGSFSYQRAVVFANRLPWRYAGVLHEYPEVPGRDPRIGRLPGPRTVVHADGGRSVGVSTVAKYARDAQTLERALGQEPDNARYQYYLARSYRDSQQWDQALTAFRRRTQMGGFDEEVHDSLYQIGLLHGTVGSDHETVVAALLAAYEYRPARAEPLCSLARYCREHQRWTLARMFAAQCVGMPRPDDLLFVDDSVYTWRSKDEYAVASYWTGDWEGSARSCLELLQGTDLPDEQRPRVQRNLEFAQARLADG